MSIAATQEALEQSDDPRCQRAVAPREAFVINALQLFEMVLDDELERIRFPGPAYSVLFKKSMDHLDTAPRVTLARIGEDGSFSTSDGALYGLRGVKALTVLGPEDQKNALQLLQAATRPEREFVIVDIEGSGSRRVELIEFGARGYAARSYDSLNKLLLRAYPTLAVYDELENESVVNGWREEHEKRIERRVSGKRD